MSPSICLAGEDFYFCLAFLDGCLHTVRPQTVFPTPPLFLSGKSRRRFGLIRSQAPWLRFRKSPRGFRKIIGSDCKIEETNDDTSPELPDFMAFLDSIMVYCFIYSVFASLASNNDNSVCLLVPITMTFYVFAPECRGGECISRCQAARLHEEESCRCAATPDKIFFLLSLFGLTFRAIEHNWQFK